MSATKTMKIGMSNGDKANQATAIRKLVVAQLFATYSSSTTYAIGEFCEYDGTIYKCIVAITTAEAWNANHWAVAKLNEVINAINEAVASVDGKANVDGNYPTLTAGNADQLNSTVYVLDKVPYLYRTSGGDADIGNREYDKIIGGSLAVNQLVDNGNFATNTKWNLHGGRGSFSVSNNIATIVTEQAYDGIWSTTNQTAYANHKYLAVVDLKSNDITQCDLIIMGANNWKNITSSWQTYGAISSVSSSSTGIGKFQLTANGAGTFNARNFVSFDLTAMFGSTIADYIYSLEQANAGAGVAWFRKYFNKLYPFNSGAIKNVKLVSHDMVGFNQWDEEWEVGYINESGVAQSGDMTLRPKNFIKVLPNTTYYVKGNPIASIFYYETDNEISFISRVVDKANSTFTTPANCHFIKFLTGTAYGLVYKNDICINLSWSGWRNGQYEPYQKNPYPLDTTIELRGIPKLDSDNHLYFDGDEYSSDGKVVRKYGIVDLGTLNWVFVEDATLGNFFRCYDNSKPGGTNANAFIVSNGKYAFQNPWGSTQLNIMVVFTNNNGLGIGIRDADYLNATAEEFKNAMSGVYLVYKLGTSTEETATPFQEPQIVDDFGTEEYVVPTQDGWQVPVGHDTKYPANLRDKLQRLPDMPSVSQNVTETYVVNYNGATKKCTFVAIDTWLGSNGYAKTDTLPTKEALGGTLRQCLCVKESAVDFNNTDYVDLGELNWDKQELEGGTVVNFRASDFGVNPAVSDNTPAHILCTKFKTASLYDVSHGIGDNEVSIRDNEAGCRGLRVCSTQYSSMTAEQFKVAMKGVLLAYEKASS